jgi:ATP dependent DNA ligase-like protein
MTLLDRSRVEIRLGDYGVAPATAVSDLNLLPRVQEYRRLVGSRMMPLAKEDIRRKVPAGEYHVSRKMDGEFTVLVVDGDDAFTINPGGTVRVGLPLLAEAQALCRQANLPRVWLAGELYVDRPDGVRPRIHDVMRVAGRPASRAEVESLRFAVFDILEPAAGPYLETWKRIQAAFGRGRAIHAVETVVARSFEDIEQRFAEWVEREGSEGLVLRSDSAGAFKVKTRHTLDVAVIGFTEGTDDRKGMIHDLLVALMRADGTFHSLARVGGGFTDDDRRAFLSDLKDMAVDSDYTEVNPDHLAYQMVRPEWVIEISCLDVISQTTRGGPIDRMVLGYHPDRRRWEIVRRLPLATLISPNYLRRRPDKSVRPDDLRLQQLTEIVDIQLADRDASRMALPRSEVLRREAWVKTLKGGKMVRKLLLWKTNKEGADGGYPAYVLHLTDFSPNRKNPLEREIRVGATLEEMGRLWDQLEDEYVVGGWVKA